MRKILPFLASLTFAAGAIALGHVWISVAMVSIATGIGLLSLRCSHSGPLGLLPPIVTADGRQLPARWYCDRCSRSWPAGIDHGRPPVQKFTGFDQSKAVHAAERAGELALRRRELAVQRAGAASRAAARRRPTSRDTRPAPIPIRDHRLVG